MADKSFFSKIGDALRGDEDETSEDIDKDIEDAVNAIKSAESDAVDGASVLMQDWGDPGDLVYVMDLVPMYEAVGNRDGPTARRLPDICANIFSHHFSDSQGYARVNGDFFIMSFVDPDEITGFRNAVVVINDIGTQMMGERFKTIELPNLVVVANIADISCENGHLDIAKAKAAVKDGGIRLASEETGTDHAAWLQNRWRALPKKKAEPAEPEWSEMHRRNSNDPDWVAERSDRRKVEVIDPSRPERRSSRARRRMDKDKDRAKGRGGRRGYDDGTGMTW